MPPGTSSNATRIGAIRGDVVDPRVALVDTRIEWVPERFARSLKFWAEVSAPVNSSLVR